MTVCTIHILMLKYVAPFHVTIPAVIAGLIHITSTAVLTACSLSLIYSDWLRFIAICLLIVSRYTLTKPQKVISLSSGSRCIT